MKKIYVHAPGENWIVDRYVNEFYQYSPQHTTKTLQDADILWMIDDWSWTDVDKGDKFLVNTVHHIVPEKFDAEGFARRDQYVDHYHAVSLKTADVLSQYTNKPITPLTFWVNEHLWKEVDDSQEALREKYELPKGKVLIGSFQRDTEGHDLRSPKLIKGPDIFCDYMESIKNTIGENLEVVLSGWRRQYVMDRLSRAGIGYHYFELCDFETLNELYNCIDLYVVSSRIEGGPQAVPECAITRTPIISTDVGLAPEILAPESVDNNLSKAMPNIDFAYDQVQKYTIDNHMQNFVDFFNRIYI